MKSFSILRIPDKQFCTFRPFQAPTHWETGLPAPYGKAFRKREGDMSFLIKILLMLEMLLPAKCTM
jgi:hypothetical protein